MNKKQGVLPDSSVGISSLSFSLSLSLSLSLSFKLLCPFFLEPEEEEEGL